MVAQPTSTRSAKFGIWHLANSMDHRWSDDLYEEVCTLPRQRAVTSQDLRIGESEDLSPRSNALKKYIKYGRFGSRGGASA
jgi:hypothetical protein